jgi:putative flippase GtrA
MVSAGSFLLNLGLTATLHELLGVREETAFAVALATVFVTNFLCLRYFVFRAGEASLTRQMTLFGLSTLGFRGLEYVFFLGLHTWLGVFYPVAIVVTLVTSLLVKYVWFKRIIFVRREVPAATRP